MTATVGSVRVHTGCSSWTSESWWGRIYTPGLPEADRLPAYARVFDSVEVDSSYYRDPGPGLVRRWARVTPPDFVFTLKVPRDLLDPKRPVDREALGRFVGNAQGLGPKLGALLLQFTPGVRPAKAEAFVRELLDALPPGPRYAVELRDAGWYTGDVRERLMKRLRDGGIALTWSYLTYLDVPPEVTADFAYLRFIGDHTTVPDETHGTIRIDRGEATRLWAGRLREASDRLKEAFAFFNNHFAGFAPASANLFRNELGLPPADLTAGLTPSAPPAPSAPRGRQRTLL